MIASSVIWKTIILPTILLAGNVYPQQVDNNIGPKLKGSTSSSLRRVLRRKPKTTTTTTTTVPTTTTLPQTTAATTTQQATSTTSVVTSTTTTSINNTPLLLVDYLYTYGAVSVSNPAISNPDNKCSKFLLSFIIISR